MVWLPEESHDAYTFVGLGVDGAARFMDVAVLSASDLERTQRHFAAAARQQRQA